MTTDLGQPISPPTVQQDRVSSACEPYRALIEQELGRGRNAMAIWQELVSDHGFPHGYQTVKRFVRRVRGSEGPQAVGIARATEMWGSFEAVAGRDWRGSVR